VNKTCAALKNGHVPVSELDVTGRMGCSVQGHPESAFLVDSKVDLQTNQVDCNASGVGVACQRFGNLLQHLCLCLTSLTDFCSAQQGVACSDLLRARSL
jgi:hypothetical protein